MTRLDLSADPAVLAALLAAGLFPAVLAMASRLPSMRARNALQFSASSLIVVGLWALALSTIAGPAPTVTTFATSFMIMAGALLVYLEAWALLSRGYTLGLLLTLYRCKTPISDAVLAASYRHGEGVGWIMRHRLGGLISARLVRREGDLIVLTFTGAVLGRLYRAAIAAFGLKVTG